MFPAVLFRYAGTEKISLDGENNTFTAPCLIQFLASLLFEAPAL